MLSLWASPHRSLWSRGSLPLSWCHTASAARCTRSSWTQGERQTCPLTFALGRRHLAWSSQTHWALQISCKTTSSRTPLFWIAVRRRKGERLSEESTTRIHGMDFAGFSCLVITWFKEALLRSSHRHLGKLLRYLWILPENTTMMNGYMIMRYKNVQNPSSLCRLNALKICNIPKSLHVYEHHTSISFHRKVVQKNVIYYLVLKIL